MADDHRLDPDFQSGIAKAAKGEHADAARLFAAALERAPSADAACNLAFCLRRLGRHDEALPTLRRALELEDGHAGAILNLTSLLIDDFQLDEAVALAGRGAALHPKDAGLRVNLASALFLGGRYAEAEAADEEALALNPDQPHAHHALSSVLLVTGRLREGFRHYLWRIQCGQAALALDGDALGIPAWTGQDLKGKTLLAVTEQGLGDTLNFLRYGALVQARGGRMVLTCARSLERLLAEADCVDGLVREGDPRPAADYHVPLLSLPHLFDTGPENIPAAIPYLTVRDEWLAEWAPRLGERRRPRVALVWAGSVGHKNDRNRSVPLALLEPLLRGGDWDCFALQVGMGEADREALDAFPGVVRLGDQVKDFADTAAILKQMDLLITVDTSVAHLAGALGVPTWVMVPAVPDWRWMLDRTDSPWYPSLRLFRQRGQGDWQGVVAAIVAALGAFVDPAAAGAQALLDAVEEWKRGRAEAATPLFAKAALLDPRLADAHGNLGVGLRRAGRIDAAIASYRRALALKPDNPDTHSNLGNALREAGRLEEGERHLRAAVRMAPDSPGIAYNLALLLRDCRKHAEARRLFAKLAKANPDSADYRWDLALTDLYLADYRRGFAGYEARRGLARAEWRVLPGAEWKPGGEVAGKTVLISAEQGFGDALQFARFFPLVAARAGRVIVETMPELAPLFARIPGVAQVVPRGGPLPAYDCWVPVMSLPLVLGVDPARLGDGVPYLGAPAPMALPRPPGARLNVGLVWAGKTRPRDRSWPLERLLPLMEDPRLAFWSLQLGERVADLETLGVGSLIRDLAPRIANFADSAAAMAAMDVIVTIDSAPAHLAGALGRPTLVLLRYVSDWRWLDEPEDCLWYPTLRLFRQADPFDFDGPVAAAKTALAKLL